MPSKRLTLVVNLEIDHEGEAPARNSVEMVELAKTLLAATPLPSHVRWGRILAYPAPTELTEEQSNLLAADRTKLPVESAGDLFNARLVKFQIEVAKAHAALETKFDRTIESLAIEEALVTRLQLPGTEWLAERELSSAEMLEVLDGYSFYRILERTRTHENFLYRALVRRLDEERQKLKGEIWEIHQDDADTWPSNPHAHNVETGYKVDLSTGDIYDPRKKRKESFLKRMPRKKLLKLRELFRSPLPELQLG